LNKEDREKRDRSALNRWIKGGSLSQQKKNGKREINMDRVEEVLFQRLSFAPQQKNTRQHSFSATWRRGQALRGKSEVGDKYLGNQKRCGLRLTDRKKGPGAFSTKNLHLIKRSANSWSDLRGMKKAINALGSVAKERTSSQKTQVKKHLATSTNEGGEVNSVPARPKFRKISES